MGPSTARIVRDCFHQGTVADPRLRELPDIFLRHHDHELTSMTSGGIDDRIDGLVPAVARQSSAYGEH